MPNAQCPQADFDLWPESAALQPTAATIAVLHLTGSKALIAASNQTAATCDTTPSHQAKMKALLMSGGKRGSLRTPDKRRLSLSGAANTARANDPAVGGQRGRVFLRRPRVVEEGGGSSGGSGGGGDAPAKSFEARVDSVAAVEPASGDGASGGKRGNPGSLVAMSAEVALQRVRLDLMAALHVQRMIRSWCKHRAGQQPHPPLVESDAPRDATGLTAAQKERLRRARAHEDLDVRVLHGHIRVVGHHLMVHGEIYAAE